MRIIKVWPDPKAVEKRVGGLAKQHPGQSTRQLSQAAIRGTKVRMSGMGGVAGLPAVVPGAGTLVQIGASGAIISGELWYMLRSLTNLQLTIAGLYGHDIHDPERETEVMIVWGLATGVVVPITEAAERIGTKVAVKQFNKRVSGLFLKRINKKVSTTVITKYGVKRGGVALGRLIPLGVGAGAGATMNWIVAVSFGRALIRYYDEIEPGSGPERGHVFVPD